VKCFTLLLRIHEVSASKLSPDTCYSGPSSVVLVTCWVSALKINHDCYLPDTSQFRRSHSRPTMRRYIT